MTFAERKSGPRCQECTLLNAPGPVPGEGNRSTTRLVYIAQNPGQNEVNATPMRPLIGASGAVFNRQLSECGLRRDEIYITNQVKCLTPENRPPTDLEVRCCRPIIDAELAACKADVVLLAGEVAFKANIGTYSSLSDRYRPTAGLMTRMGCVEQRSGRKWIGTIHPAFIMRMPEYKQCALDHLKKAASIAGVAIPLPTVIEHPEPQDIARHRDAARAGRMFADDVETRPLDPNDLEGEWWMDICGYSAIRYEAIILARDEIHDAMGEIHADPGITVFEQNGTYESQHIPQVTTVANRKFDTMHALHYLRSYYAGGGDEDDPKKSGLGLALKPHVVSLFTNLPYYERNIEAAVGRRFYCGLDNIATYLAGREQWRQLKEWGLEELFFRDGMRIPYILEEWKVRGARVDLSRALLFRKFLTQRVAQGQLMISKITPVLFNPGSPKQVAELLYDLWQLPRQFNKKRVGRAVTQYLTTDNEARKRLRAWIAKQPPDVQAKYQRARIFLDLQDYVEGEATKLTFLDRIAADGRIHPRYKPTSTFRIATSPNIQNWPIYDLAQWGGARRDVKSEGAAVPTGEVITAMGSLRSIVIPDEPGNLNDPYDNAHTLETLDFEQIEIWMYAKQTNCKWLLDMYERGEYIYGTFYEMFYDLPFFQTGMPRKKKFKLENVSEKFLRRTKAIPLGWLYKRGNSAIAEEHQMPLTEVEKYHRRWCANTPELQSCYANDEFTMNQKGWIRYPFGHVIHYPNRKPSESAANRGQNPAGGMLRSSIILIHDELKRREFDRDGVRMLFTVHDSLTLNIPQPLVEEVTVDVVRPILNRQVPELGGFVFRSSCEVGKRWDWDDATMSPGAQEYSEWLTGYKAAHAS